MYSIQYFNNLILVLQNNSSHFTLIRVKCEKQNFALGRVWTHDSCIRGKRLTARPRGPNWLTVENKQHRG